MTELTQDITLAQSAVLLSRYGFEMKGYIPQELIDKWLKDYPAKWIRAAIVEALYQGRYKAISVEQILKLWERRKQVTCHFTHEFERLICRNLPYSSQWQEETSLGIPDSLKTKPRKQVRKPFNPPIVNGQDTVLTTTTKQNDLSYCPEGENTLEAEKFSEEVLPSLTVEQHDDIDSQQVNQLSYAANKLLLPSTQTDNTLVSKEALTDIDELFTQILIGSDVQLKSNIQPVPHSSRELVINPNPSDSDAENDRVYQWRGIIPGRTIDEFTPQLDSSELYSKLKAVVGQDL